MVKEGKGTAIAGIWIAIALMAACGVQDIHKIAYLGLWATFWVSVFG